MQGVAFGPGWDVRGQLPVALADDSEPEPDVANGCSRTPAVRSTARLDALPELCALQMPRLKTFPAEPKRRAPGRADRCDGSGRSVLMLGWRPSPRRVVRVMLTIAHLVHDAQSSSGEFPPGAQNGSFHLAACAANARGEQPRPQAGGCMPGLCGLKPSRATKE